MQYIFYLIIAVMVIYMKKNYYKVDSMLGFFIGGLALIYRMDSAGQILIFLCAVFVFFKTEYFDEEITQLRVIVWVFYCCAAAYNILMGTTIFDNALHIIYVYNLFKYTILKRKK